MFFKEGQNFPTLDLLLFLQYWYTFLIYIPCFRQTQSTDYEPSLYYTFINKRNGVFLEAKTKCFMDFSCHTSCERDQKQWQIYIYNISLNKCPHSNEHPLAKKKCPPLRLQSQTSIPQRRALPSSLYLENHFIYNSFKSFNYCKDCTGE